MKLTLEQARAIRAARDVSRNELARRYGVTPGTISHIRTGHTWAEPDNGSIMTLTRENKMRENKMTERYVMWPDGTLRSEVDTSDMFEPVRCAHCSKVYDLGKVEVTARYVDCSMWKCPGCKRTVDDRGETGWKSLKDYYRLGR